MEYIFGNIKLHQRDIENLKTVGENHTDFTGKNTVERVYDDTTITDTFEVVSKYHSTEDTEGNCYDFYEIKNHERTIDFSPKKNQQMQEKDNSIDELLVLLLEGGAVNG